MSKSVVLASLVVICLALVVGCSTSVRYYGVADLDSRVAETSDEAPMVLTTSGSTLDPKEQCYHILGKVYVKQKSDLSTPGEKGARKKLAESASALGAKYIYGFHTGADQIWSGEYWASSDTRWSTGVAVSDCPVPGGSARTCADFIISILPPFLPPEWSDLSNSSLDEMDDWDLVVCKAIDASNRSLRYLLEKKGYYVDFPTQAWSSKSASDHSLDIAESEWHSLQDLSEDAFSRFIALASGYWSDKVLFWFPIIPGKQELEEEGKFRALSSCAIYTRSTGEWNWLFGEQSAIFADHRMLLLSGFSDIAAEMPKKYKRFDYSSFSIPLAEKIAEAMPDLGSTEIPR